MSNLEDLVNTLSSLTLLEVSQLTRMLREKWGITETISKIMTLPDNFVRTIETAIEKEYFDVVIRAIGSKKIDVIKATRQLTNLGLKDAKDLVETKDGIVLHQVDKTTAEDAERLLSASGASIELVWGK